MLVSVIILQLHLINSLKLKIVNNADEVILIDLISGFIYILISWVILGFKYSMRKSKNMINNLYSVLFSDEKREKIKALGLYNEENLIEVNKVKSMINNYIKKSNKRIVFIIDNIDRAEKENVMLIFKLVNNIFDFKNITYILAFDDEQIKRIIKKDLNVYEKFKEGNTDSFGQSELVYDHEIKLSL